MSSEHAAAPTPTTLPTDDDVLQGGVQDLRTRLPVGLTCESASSRLGLLS